MIVVLLFDNDLVNTGQPNCNKDVTSTRIGLWYTEHGCIVETPNNLLQEVQER